MGASFKVCAIGVGASEVSEDATTGWRACMRASMAYDPAVERHDHHPWEDQMKTVEDVQTWRGMKMVDVDGDKIGTIEDIFLDRQTGQPAWAAVKTGLFGRKQTLVPIQDAELTEDNEVRVSLQKEQVKDAPRIDAEGELTPEEERTLWKHYGLSDYDEWRGDDRTRALTLPDEDEDRARRSATETEARNGAPAIVGVRLRRVVVVTIPAGEREHGKNV
jgi:sporulation protein YlmC with PRC-barrel domain